MLCFFTYLSVSISSLVKLPAIETIFFSFFDLLSKSSRRVHGTRLACFALFFTHDHESVKCKSVSREMYTSLEVKLCVSGEKLTRSMISEIRILLLANSSNDKIIWFYQLS